MASESGEPGPSTSRESVDELYEPVEPYVKRRLYTSEVLAMWCLSKIVRELGTREECIAFAEAQGLICTEKLCGVHRKPMNINYCVNKTVGAFVCRKGSCHEKGRRISRSKGTWFDNIKIKLPHVFYLMYCFAYRWSTETVIREDPFKIDTCLSSVTICDWYNYCRETVVIYQLDKQENKSKIGGPGKVVQIDETKFGKRKYNKGRRMEGHWVLGMIEDGSEDLRLEVCPDNNRSADILVPLIKKHVKEGTTIHTDCWRAYNCLSEHGFIHYKVNHSDPDNPFVAADGTHTQRIVSQWRVVKRFFYKNNYNHPLDFGDVIVEYLWRRNVLIQKKDSFMELIKAVHYVYPAK